MLTHKNMISFQADEHWMILSDECRTLHEYIIYLSQAFAYEYAMSFVDNKKVLDIGCNTGYGTKILSNTAKSVVGVDISKKAITLANKLFNGQNLSFKIIDGINLPYHDNEFDIVLSFQVIEHIVDYEIYLSEIKRVLSPDGIVMFTTPNSIIRLDPGMKPWNRFHVREFSAKELEELLNDYFSEIKVRGLFANEPVYSIEMNRVNDMRVNARVNIKKWTSLTNYLKTGIKTLMPNDIVQKIRLIRKKNNLVFREINKDFKTEYSTSDFYYSDDDLNHALDLLAFCNNCK